MENVQFAGAVEIASRPVTCELGGCHYCGTQLTALVPARDFPELILIYLEIHVCLSGGIAADMVLSRRDRRKQQTTDPPSRLPQAKFNHAFYYERENQF